MSAGIPLSEHMTDVQDGRHLPGHPPSMEKDYSGKDEPRIYPVDGRYPPEQIE